MAKNKTINTNDTSSLVQEALKALNAGATTTKAYQLGAHAEHTWGIQIPTLAFQWLVGGSNVFPAQRFLSLSGVAGSLKSTLGIEIAKWYAQQNGLGVYIDNESKSSASMFDAMTWWCLTDEQRSRLAYKEVANMEEWMSVLTELIKFSQQVGYGKKGERLPVFALIDSLTGKAATAEQEAVADEGFAAARGFPTRAAAITRYLETMQLTGTLMSVGYVRHLKQAIDGTGHGPPQSKETGGAAAQFKASLSIRLTKGPGIEYTDHPALPHRDVTCQGYTVWMESNKSCLGPDKRKLEVEVVWQYVMGEDGIARQIMTYDWSGALGRLLWSFKYFDKTKLYAQDIERLNKALEFSNPKGKLINCEELGLKEVSFTEFGRAIEANQAVRERIARFLFISQYNDIQAVELEPVKA